jgi:hypothetical protein
MMSTNPHPLVKYHSRSRVEYKYLTRSHSKPIDDGLDFFKDKIDIQIGCVRATHTMYRKDYAVPESGKEAERTALFLYTLDSYELFLWNQKTGVATDLASLRWMKQAIRDAGCLLVDLGRDEPELMQGWFHGIRPANQAHAMGNLLSRIILDLSIDVHAFESRYPELKDIFDAERSYQASLIQMEECVKEAEISTNKGKQFNDYE